MKTFEQEFAEAVNKSPDDYVREEREACAALVEAEGCTCPGKRGMEGHWRDCPAALAAAIRARGGAA